MNRSKKAVSVLASLAMVSGLFAAIPSTASAEGGYTYVERYWDSERKVVGSVTKTVTKPSNLGSTDCDMSINGAYFWVVDGNIRIRGKLVCQGDVKILVCDGSTLTIDDGIIVQKSSYGLWTHLSIYGQENDSGKVIATGAEYDTGMTTYRSAGIGSYQGFDNGCSDIYIHGGDIQAMGAENAAGIGNAKGKTGGSVTIFGGKVRAESYGSAMGVGSDGAGIGGAEGLEKEEGSNHLDSVTIYGGEVTAISHCNGAGIGGGENGNGGNINIYGGTVTAISERDGAGIGGGNDGNGGNINIYGGRVTATSEGDGAGIGGGCHGNGGNINIYGDVINATGNDDGAGIGGGYYGNSGNINIYNGVVTALSKTDGAGIGGGDTGNGGNINIYDGTIIATSNDEGAGIGGGYGGAGGTIKIYGGRIQAANGDQGAGIGGGDTGNGGDIYIYGGDVTAMPKKDGDAIGGGDDGNSGNLTIGDGMRVTSGSSNESATLKTKDNRVSGCRELYAHVYQCEDHDWVTRDYYMPDPNVETHSDGYCNYCNASHNKAPHDYGYPIWSWEEDRSGAKLLFACQTCGNTEEFDGTVTSDVQEGMTVYTASATAHDKSYTQSVSVAADTVATIEGISYNQYPGKSGEQDLTAVKVYISTLGSVSQLGLSYKGGTPEYARELPVISGGYTEIVLGAIIPGLAVQMSDFTAVLN